jgi:hypothetical protein
MITYRIVLFSSNIREVILILSSVTAAQTIENPLASSSNMPAKEGAKYLPRTEALPDSSGKSVTKIFVAPGRFGQILKEGFPGVDGNCSNPLMRAIGEAGRGSPDLEQFTFRESGFRSSTIQANEKAGEYENGRLLQTLQTRKVDDGL